MRFFYRLFPLFIALEMVLHSPHTPNASPSGRHAVFAFCIRHNGDLDWLISSAFGPGCFHLQLTKRNSAHRSSLDVLKTPSQAITKRLKLPGAPRALIYIYSTALHGPAYKANPPNPDAQLLGNIYPPR